MVTLKRLVAGMLVACCLISIAWADATEDANGYAADDVAVNQAAVAYWYAHGFANAFGHFPENWAELQSHGLPLRDFVSPHTGQAINFDDGTLDFDGDMMYVPSDCGDVEIHVQTSTGEFVIPGSISGTDDCCRPYCCPVQICGYTCWNICDDQEAACKIIGWMMWESFETYICRYGKLPCDEKDWMASGFATVGMNWRELAPYMDIEYIWGNCGIKKAYVNCCRPCAKPCCKTTSCNKCNKCKQDTCSTCKTKCAKPCCKATTCDKCSKCKQDTCSTCKPKCEKPCCKATTCDKCSKCKPTSCVKCKQDTCTTCKPKCTAAKPCGKCDKCTATKACAKPCCKDTSCNKCNKCKQDTCTTCKPKCNTCKQDTCTTCKPACTAAKPCGKCDKCTATKACGKCDKCKKDTCTTCKPKCDKCSKCG